MRFTLLRAFVVAALLANLLYAAWAAGWLGWAGLAPATQRDPQRAEQQVRPAVMRVLPPAAVAAATAAANASTTVVGPPPPPPAPTPDPAADAASAPGASGAPAAPGAPASAAAPSGSVSLSGGAVVSPPALAAAGLACVEVGPFDGAAALDEAQRALAAAVPGVAPAREQRPARAQYAVFVGPVMSRDSARLRREELLKLKIGFEAIELPDGRSGGKIGGYAVGRHDSETAALANLESLRERGLKNARVVLAREEGAPRTWLRLDRLSPTQLDAVRALPAAQLGGQGAGECIVGSVMSVRVPR